MAPTRQVMQSRLRRCFTCCADDSESSEQPHEFDNFLPDRKMGEKYDQIKRRCLSSNTLYEDPDFPASSRVLFRNGPVYGVRWKRPKEISRTPVYAKQNAVYYDMDQGSIGNCWFVASVACLAASPQNKLLSRVVPTDQGFGSDYCGAFRFFFWQYGKWVEVVVDDRLPTYNNRLIYSSNNEDPNEYWCPLLEKAFAKLHGNYHVIDGGRIHSALVDLTGGLGEMIPLRNKIRDDDLTHMLINCFKMNSFMGGAIFNSDEASREVKLDTGLYEGHAYSIVDVRQVRTRNGTTTILHVRNPWGRGEWKGAWSDGSPEWKTLEREDRNSTYKTRNDGEFWISVSDFRKHFDELELCHLTPDALSQEIANNLDRSEWKKTEHHGSWVAGISAGGPPVSFTSRKFWSNPQFRLQLTDAKKPTTVVISLFEVENLLKRGVSDISIGFVIFQLQKGKQPSRITASNFYEYTPRLVETSGIYWPYRERTVRFTVEPANHVIVPCTFKPGQQAEFYMRVFAESEVIASPIDAKDEVDGDYALPMSPADVADAAIDKTFDKYADGVGVIDAAELVEVFKAGLESSEGKTDGFNVETCRCIVGLSNPSDTGLVDREGVRKIWDDLQIWRKAFRLADKNKTKAIDTSELKSLFEIIDFNVGPEAIGAIMERYGGKEKKITEEDFLQSFCKSLQLYRIFKELANDKKINMDLNEWMTTGLKT